MENNKVTTILYSEGGMYRDINVIPQLSRYSAQTGLQDRHLNSIEMKMWDWGQFISSTWLNLPALEIKLDHHFSKAGILPAAHGQQAASGVPPPAPAAHTLL